MGVGEELEDESEDQRKWGDMGEEVRVENGLGRRKVLGADRDGEGLLTNLAYAPGRVALLSGCWRIYVICGLSKQAVATR